MKGWTSLTAAILLLGLAALAQAKPAGAPNQPGGRAAGKHLPAAFRQPAAAPAGAAAAAPAPTPGAKARQVQLLRARLERLETRRDRLVDQGNCAVAHYRGIAAVASQYANTAILVGLRYPDFPQWTVLGPTGPVPAGMVRGPRCDFIVGTLTFWKTRVESIHQSWQGVDREYQETLAQLQQLEAEPAAAPAAPAPAPAAPAGPANR